MDEMRKFLGLAADSTDKDVADACMKRMKKFEDDAAEMKKKFDDMDGDDDDKKMSDDAEVMADDKDESSALQKMAKVLGFSGKTTISKMAGALDTKFVSTKDVSALSKELEQIKSERAEEKKAAAQTFARDAVETAIKSGRMPEKKREAFAKIAQRDAAEFECLLDDEGTHTVVVAARRRFARGGDPIGKTPEAPIDPATLGVDPQEIGADLAVKARKYAKDTFGKVDGMSLRKAYIALGKIDNSYGESIDRLRGNNSND